jgi:hypothetical protein
MDVENRQDNESNYAQDGLNGPAAPPSLLPFRHVRHKSVDLTLFLGEDDGVPRR